MRGKVSTATGRALICAAAGFAAFTSFGFISAVRGAVLFSDGFESYTAGAAPLDKNTTGPNSAPNGSGNPWFGPLPPNNRVVTTEGGVTPHSGTQMIRGSNPSEFDQNWVNVGYRFNGGQAYKGNVQLDFWFYDPNGSGASASDYREFGALGFYNTAPSNTDYPTGGSLNTGVTQIQRLCLGASSDVNGNFDNTKYQARIVGAAGGFDPGSGWFNTSISRSVGWHHGTVLAGAALGDGTNLVTFSIDGVTAFSGNSTTNYGYNVIELNTDYGPTNGYMDDVSFNVIPEPTSLAIFAIGSGLLLRSRRRS